MPVIRAKEVSTETASPSHLAKGFGAYNAALFSDDAGLTQFGAFVETLAPGSRSGPAHWHEEEDEFVFVLSGTLRVIEGEEVHDLNPGDAAAFRAGVPCGHYLMNVSSSEVSYLVVGTRAPRDVAHLTEEDATLHREGQNKRWVNRAGQPLLR